MVHGTSGVKVAGGSAHAGAGRTPRAQRLLWAFLASYLGSKGHAHMHIPNLLARTRTALVTALPATILDRADPARCTLSRHEQEVRAKLHPSSQAPTAHITHPPIAG